MLEAIEAVPWRANVYLITVAELRSALEDLNKFLTEEERDKLIEFLAFNPEGGIVVENTCGVRKIRWRYKKGKYLRVFYFFHDLNMPLYLLAVLGPGERFRPTKREERRMRALVATLVEEHSNRTWSSLDRDGAA